MRTSVKVWEKDHHAVSVNHGPLTFALAIGEQWNQIGGTTRWPEYEVLPRTPWNYGLAVDGARPEASFALVKKSVPPGANPWTPDGCPVALRVQARKIEAWRQIASRSCVPCSPARRAPRPCWKRCIWCRWARLRISTFPAASTGPGGHPWTLPQATVTSSFTCGRDTTEALQDYLHPASSHDDLLPRFTWWPRKGSAEWVVYTYPQPRTLSHAAVYWYDGGGCRLPASWRLLYQDGSGNWKPVQALSAYGTARDQMNPVSFVPVTTRALKLEAQLLPDASAGILQWHVQKGE